MSYRAEQETQNALTEGSVTPGESVVYLEDRKRKKKQTKTSAKSGILTGTIKAKKIKKRNHSSVKTLHMCKHTHAVCVCVRHALFVCDGAGWKPKQRRLCDATARSHLHMEAGGWRQKTQNKTSTIRGGAGGKNHQHLPENTLPHASV